MPDCDTGLQTTFVKAPAVPNGTFSTDVPSSAVHNGTFTSGRSNPPVDVTFEKEPCISEVLSATFDKPAGGPSFCDPFQPSLDAERGGEESQSAKRSSPQSAGLNSTFSRSNSSGGGPGRGDVASFGLMSRGSGGGQRKMSEDRLSSASSG